MIAVYLPAVHLELVGDDYQWVQHAQRAVQRPSLLLADLDGFFRPAGTWTLVVDRLLWPWSPPGYHVTNLLLHALATALLGVAARRLGVPPGGAVVVGALWGISPWAADAAIHIAVRFDTLLVASWCLMTAVWPRDGESWRGGRRAVATAAIVLAALSKETWVVTPGLVLLLDLVHRRQRGVAAFVPTALVTAAVLVYSTLHVTLLSLGRTYFVWEWGLLAKMPQQLAAFLLLTPHQAAEFHFTPAAFAAILALGAALLAAWRTRSPVMAVGLGLLLLPALPTLGTPVLPLRYATASYAGFVLVVAGVAVELGPRLPSSLRRPAAAAVTAGALALAVWGGVRVRLELEDARAVSDAHARLLRQAAEVAHQVPEGVPLIVLTTDGVSPLADIAASPVGWKKPFFVRGSDPAGLVDSVALLAWSRRDPTLDVVHLSDWTTAPARRPGRVLFYSWAQGFKWGDAWVADAGALATALRAQGAGVRLVLASHPAAQVS